MHQQNNVPYRVCPEIETIRILTTFGSNDSRNKISHVIGHLNQKILKLFLQRKLSK